MRIKSQAKLLYLVHRIPYPPNKGDKIRSFHILKYLAKYYQIYLAGFVDQREDEAYISALTPYCEDSCFVRLAPIWSKLKSLKALITGDALSLPYYQNDNLQQWVDDVLNTYAIDKIFVFSSVMAQYISLQEACDAMNCVMDFVDIDSDKWAQYARSKSWPMSWVYQRESQKLFDYEKQISLSYHASLFVSDAEANLFKCLVPEAKHKIHAMSNGVDIEFFDPNLVYDNPYPENKKIIIFTGAMDYWPNVDAVVWFVETIFSSIKSEQLLFYIVGSNPSAQVLALKHYARVFITGRVADIRPYLANADIAVAPLRLARGIQNKVLEAMVMAKPILVTPQAKEGISFSFEQYQLLSEQAEFWRLKLLELSQNSKLCEDIGYHLRTYVIDHYSWSFHLKKLPELLKG